MPNHLEALVAFGEAVDLAGLVERPSWQAKAACRGHPTDLFFPSRCESNDAAKAICARCPVTPECYACALDGDDIGIWAGMSGRGRREATGRAA